MMSPGVTRYGRAWMCAVMKWEGCARRSGRSSLTESERGLGSDCEGGCGAVEGSLGVNVDGEDATSFDDGGASRGTSKPSGGDSMICAVELKYRARLGRRKVGGNADAGNRMSKTDFLIDLLNILKMLAGGRSIDRVRGLEFLDLY
jgi:hypothetical protein